MVWTVLSLTRMENVHRDLLRCFDTSYRADRQAVEASVQVVETFCTKSSRALLRVRKLLI